MIDIWVVGETDSEGNGIGAWVCPMAEVYATTVKARAIDEDDGIRVGMAMAILSAYNQLGSELRVHVPFNSTYPDWLVDPRADCHPTYSPYRVTYRAVIMPAIAIGEIALIPEKQSPEFSQLYGLLKGKEAFKRCTRLG